MPQVLIIEDEPLLSRNVQESLADAGYRVFEASTGEEGLEQAERLGPDVILLDLRLPGMDGMEVLRELHRRGGHASIVVMTAHGSIETAVEAMKCGALDFITKPLDLVELQIVIERILEHRRTADQLEYFRRREQASSALEQILGSSKPMTQVKQFVRRLAASPALGSDTPPTLLITGETGTGKDLVARAVHFSGARAGGPFIHVNCTALPDHLVESELFGHVKGAFTDARTDRRGLLHSADGGTLFLDEIGHMKAPLQAKLLTTLEHRRIRPVGGTREQVIDVHVIAATNRNLEESIAAGEFREDLYHRLRVLTLHMPALRERGDDVVELAQHFLMLYASRFGLPPARLSGAAIEALRAYHWPGNVRELSHTLESAVLIAAGQVIEPEDLNLRVKPRGAQAEVHVGEAPLLKLDFAGDCPRLEEIEYRIIKAAVEFCRHNLSKAARILGISRDAIRYRMERFERGHTDQPEPEREHGG